MAVFQHSTKAFNNIFFVVASLWYYGHVENSGIISPTLICLLFFLQLKWWFCAKSKTSKPHPTSNINIYIIFKHTEKGAVCVISIWI